MAGDPSAAAAGDPSAAPYPVRLREALAALSQACDSGVSDASEAASFTVSDILDAAASMSSEADNGSDDCDEAAAAAGVSEELLREVHEFLARSASNQMAIDALSLVLPKPVAKLGAQAVGCWDVATAILKFFVTNCSPRDMLSILCEALDVPMELPNGSSIFVLLHNALAEGQIDWHATGSDQVQDQHRSEANLSGLLVLIAGNTAHSFWRQQKVLHLLGAQDFQSRFHCSKVVEPVKKFL